MSMATSRGAVLAAVLAALAVGASVVARLVVNVHATGPARAYAYTDLQNILVESPFLEQHWPYLRFPFDYHPLLGWTTGLLSVVGDGLVAVVLLWAVLLAAAAAAVALLLARLAPASRVIAFWSLSPQLLLLGGHNFDVLPVLGLVGAAVATRAGRIGVGGAALGLGAAAKLFPIAALPPLALSLLRRSPRLAVAAVASASAVLIVVDGPALLAPYGFLSTAHNPYRYPGNLETIWLPVRLVLDQALEAAAREQVVAVVSGLGMAASYLWWVVRPAVRGADPVPLFFRAVVVILLWTQLYSPQYSIWLLPIFVLLVPRRDVFLLLVTGDVLVWLTAFPLSVEPSGPLLAGLLAGVLLRHCAIVLLLARLVRLGDTLVRRGPEAGLPGDDERRVYEIRAEGR